MDNKTIIFCDGSSIGNPGPGGWGAIVCGDNDVMELGGGEKHTTNNRMELEAAIHALQVVKNDREIFIYTDSAYVIGGMTKWIYGWQKNNWITSQKEEVLNKDLWEKLIFSSEGKKISWKKIAGHAGIPGNERCDEVAVSFAEGKSPKLFKGKLSDYKINLSVVSSAGKTAYSYVSLANGVFKKHKIWKECEKEVRGVKGAKFRKTTSAENEKEIEKEWLS